MGISLYLSMTLSELIKKCRNSYKKRFQGQISSFQGQFSYGSRYFNRHFLMTKKGRDWNILKMEICKTFFYTFSILYLVAGTAEQGYLKGSIRLNNIVFFNDIVFFEKKKTFSKKTSPSKLILVCRYFECLKYFFRFQGCFFLSLLFATALEL